MNSKKNTNFKVAKKKVQRRSQRRKILRFIFRKLLFLSLLRKFFRIALKYLFIAYAAATIGFNAGNQQSKDHFQSFSRQREEVSELNKNLKESLGNLSIKNDQIQQLEHSLLERGKSYYELDKSFQKTLKQLSEVKSEQAKLFQEIKSSKINTKKLENNKKQAESVLVFFEKKIKNSKHQFETKEVELKNNIQLLSEDLRDKNDEISILTESFDQKLSLIENLETKIKSVQLEEINLNSETQLLKQEIKLIQEEFEAKRQEYDNKYNKLELQMVIKNNQLELKELRIQELNEQLQSHDQALNEEFSKLRSEFKALSNKLEDLEAQKRLDWILRFIDRILSLPVKKFS
jgi:chromosome segregation ATPase